MRYFYTVFFYLAFPFVLLRMLWRSRQNPEYRRRFKERFGFCPHRFDKCIWVHAVSVGETIAAIPLVKALKKNYPHLPILMTTMTITGSARVKAAFGDSLFHAYIPYDLPGMVKRFLQRIHPQMVVVMETELWPNLFAACKERHIPIIIANARLSIKSMRGYKYITPLLRDVFSAVNVLAAQAQGDAERFMELGLPAEKITVTGNLKFDLEMPVDLFTNGKKLRAHLGEERLTWIAASTHQNEEEIILAAHRLVQKKFPHALLVLVPRHPERFPSVATLVEQQGFNMVRRSNKSECLPHVQVYLGDTMGELLLLYSVADVVFVAGSFVPLGGHNMLEPAALHKSILTGPHVFNFSDITQMLQAANGVTMVHDANELADQIIRFFMDADYRKKVGENAYSVVAANRGALQKQLELINNNLVIASLTL